MLHCSTNFVALGMLLLVDAACALLTSRHPPGFIIVRFTKRDRAQPESARGVGGISLVITVIIESTLIYSYVFISVASGPFLTLRPSGTKFINLMLLIAQSNVSYTFFCIVRLWFSLTV